MAASADDQGTLAEAVAEANRYAKSMMNRCPNCDRPQADDHWCARCLQAAPRCGPMLSILYTCGLIVATGERRPNQRGDEELTVWVAAKRRPPGALTRARAMAKALGSEEYLNRVLAHVVRHSHG